MEPSEDEKVDGVQIAADILLQMDAPRRTRILNMMQAKSPQDAQKVSKKINSLTRLFSVDSRTLEGALRRVSDHDIALALKTETDELCRHIYNHISPRRKAVVEETRQELPPTPLRVVLGAQKRLVDALEGGLEVVG
jgi:flagellar motor switch protein FliG